MIITFDPKIASASNQDAVYINFLRCITAAVTAPAGATSLTVNPYTTSNNIDTTKNCIVSIDANTEAGGWTVSPAHNVPSSGNNTPQSFTTITSNGSASVNYKADFYVDSGKSAVPYLKLSFHIPSGTQTSTDGYGGPAYPSEWSSYPYVQSTFGHSTTTAWLTPTVGSAPANATSMTPFKDTAVRQAPNYCSTYNPWYMPGSTGIVLYRIAVTANYCIIWEVKPTQNSYVDGYNTTSLSLGDTSYYQRLGSIIYHGLRETQGWENTYNDNPPWVSWGYLHSAIGRTSSTTYTHFPTNCVGAWMRTQTNTSQVSTPSVRSVYNTYSDARTQDTSMYAYNTHALQVPLFKARVADGTYMGITNATLNPPQADPVTGLQVPGAYPIIIRSTIDGAYNAGGACRGIYKSLSMPYANMKNYWTAANQTFNINGEPYIPVVISQDMWLIRNA